MSEYTFPYTAAPCLEESLVLHIRDQQGTVVADIVFKSPEEMDRYLSVTIPYQEKLAGKVVLS